MRAIISEPISHRLDISELPWGRFYWPTFEPKGYNSVRRFSPQLQPSESTVDNANDSEIAALIAAVRWSNWRWDEG